MGFFILCTLEFSYILPKELMEETSRFKRELEIDLGFRRLTPPSGSPRETLEAAREAYDHYERGEQFGKIVLKVRREYMTDI